MSEIEVFEVGAACILDGDIPATITAIEIRGSEHMLTYQVTWWDERARKSEWVTPAEIKQAKERRKLRFAS